VQSGTKTASSSAVQTREAMTGCSSGHAPLAGAAGLPNSFRVAVATALTGFQLAIRRSQAGMPEVGTKALDRPTTGKIRKTGLSGGCCDGDPEQGESVH